MYISLFKYHYVLNCFVFVISTIISTCVKSGGFYQTKQNAKQREGSILITARIMNRHICTVWTFNTALKIVLCLFLIVLFSHFMRKLFYTLIFFSPFTSLIPFKPLHPPLACNWCNKTEKFMLELISSSFWLSKSTGDYFHCHSDCWFSSIRMQAVFLLLKDHLSLWSQLLYRLSSSVTLWVAPLSHLTPGSYS